MKKISMGKDYRRIWPEVLKGNIGISGAAGSGKTNTALSLVCEAVSLNYAIITINICTHHQLFSLSDAHCFFPILRKRAQDDNSSFLYIQDQLTLPGRISIIRPDLQEEIKEEIEIASLIIAVLERVANEKRTKNRAPRVLLIIDGGFLGFTEQRETRKAIELLRQMSKEKWLRLCVVSQRVSDIPFEVLACCSTHILHCTGNETDVDNLKVSVGKDSKSIESIATANLEVGEAILVTSRFRKLRLIQVKSCKDTIQYINLLGLIRDILWNLGNSPWLPMCLYYMVYLLTFNQLLKNSFLPFLLPVPRQVISLLSEKELLTLVSATLDAQGTFHDLRYNLKLISRRLTPLALSQPAYYKRKIGNKLSLALTRDKKEGTHHENV